MYDIKNSRGTIIASIDEKAVDVSSTSLTLHGRGFSPYGTRRNENYVHLLENFSNSVAPSSPMDGQIWWDSANRLLKAWDTTIGSPAGMFVEVVPPTTGQGFAVIAGAGLTGGGLPTGSPSTVTIDVGAGTGIQINAGSPESISTLDGAIEHDNLSGFVANEHIDHSAIILTAGKGMTGTGDITATRTFNIVAGDGITVNADTVEPDSTVVRTTGAQTIAGTKIFLDQIRADSTASAAAPGYSFNTDSNTGVYLSGTDQISFATGATQRFRIESNGTLRSLNSTYEALVTDDDDIPNKKYVDDTLAAVATPTNNTFTGTSSLSGLNGDETYLVNVYGTLPSKGTGWGYLSSINLRRGSTTIGVGTLAGTTPFDGHFNWMDGHCPTSTAFIVEMNGDTQLNCVVNEADPWSVRIPASWMSAVQLTDSNIVLGSPSWLGDIELDDVSGGQSPIGSVIWPDSATALATLRFYLGNAEVAAGNTNALLIFNQIGDDWLISGNESDFELYVSSVSTSGAGIGVSGTLNTWVSLSSARLYTLSQTTGFYVGTWEIQCEIRQITDPSNTTGQVNYTLRTEIVI